MEQLEVLTEVQDLRKIWPHEALDFTPWLAKDKNIAILGNEIGMEIAVDGTESAVGDFSVDIIATDIATGQKVIIENQLEDTNHDHLGKLITYAAGKEARTIIWVVKHAREEHRAAIEWLILFPNENAPRCAANFCILSNANETQRSSATLSGMSGRQNQKGASRWRR